MNWEIEIDIYTLLILCLSVKSLQSFLTLWDPMDCSLPGSSVRGEFSRQEYWSGLPCLSPGDLPNPGIQPASPAAPALQADSLLLSHQGSPILVTQPSKSCWSEGFSGVRVRGCSVSFDTFFQFLHPSSAACDHKSDLFFYEFCL